MTLMLRHALLNSWYNPGQTPTGNPTCCNRCSPEASSCTGTCRCKAPCRRTCPRGAFHRLRLLSDGFQVLISSDVCDHVGCLKPQLTDRQQKLPPCNSAWHMPQMRQGTHSDARKEAMGIPSLDCLSLSIYEEFPRQLVLPQRWQRWRRKVRTVERADWFFGHWKWSQNLEICNFQELALPSFDTAAASAMEMALGRREEAPTSNGFRVLRVQQDGESRNQKYEIYWNLKGCIRIVIILLLSLSFFHIFHRTS